MSSNDVGSMPYSAGGRPATALSPMFGSSWPRNDKTSVPSSFVTTRGASSAYFAGRWPSHMPGGSTTWSSTETRIMSSSCMGVPLVVEAEDARRVAGEDAVPFVGGHARHRVVDHLARVRPVVAVVRVVGAPHHVVDADRVAVHDAVAVGDERGRQVAVPVERRWLGDRDLAPRAVAPVAVVHLLQEVRDPPDTGLDERHLQ